MNKKILYLIILIGAFAGMVTAQNVTHAEYFFDTDPGAGIGKPISITEGADIDLSTSVNATGLAVGFHRLFVRVKNNYGNWSIANSIPFYVYNNTTPIIIPPVTYYDVAASEYFFDTDPGVNKGKPIAITSSGAIDLTTDIFATGLPVGFHRIFVRVKNTAGNWSIANSILFYVYDNAAPTTQPGTTYHDVTGSEYFFDTDPGINKGKPISVTAGSTVDLNTDALTAGLNIGFHRLFVRVKNAAGNWSIANSIPFYVFDNAAPVTQSGTTYHDVAASEYFFDTDPGVNNGKPITITSGNAIDISPIINAVNLSVGFHRLFIRVKNAAGNWSPANSVAFYVYDSTPANPKVAEATNIVKAEYFMDSDKGFNSGNPISITPSNNISKDISLSVGDLPAGNHTINVRVQNNKGVWSFAENVQFGVFDCDLPAVPATPTGDNSVCASQTNLIYTTTGANLADSYEWKIEPAEAGTIVSDNLTATVSWSAAFFGNAKLYVRGINSCSTGNWSVPLTVYVKGIPAKITTITGNQSVCANIGNQTYSFSPVEFAESYKWYISDNNAATIAGNVTQAVLSFKNDFAGSFSISAQAINECGSSQVSGAYNIDVKGLARVSAISGLNELCMNPSDNLYSTTGTDAEQYTWTIVPSEAAIFSSTTNNVSVNWNNTFSGTATLKVTASNACGAGFNSTEQEIKIYQPVAKTSLPVGETAVCFNSVNTIYTTGVTTWATGYVWSVTPSNASVASSNLNNLTLDWNEAYSGDVQISVHATNVCGSGTESDALTVFVKPLPAIPDVATGDTDLCANSADQLYGVPAVTYADTYMWQIVETDAGIITGNTKDISVNWNDTYSGTANLQVIAVNNCGSSAESAPLSVNLRPLPSNPTMPTGTTALCINPSNQTYSVLAPAFTTDYVWNLTPADAGVLTGTGTSIELNWRNDFFGFALITVKGTSECGESQISPELNILVRPLPGKVTLPVGETAVCFNSPNNIYTTNQDTWATDYVWSVTPANSSVVSSNLNNLTLDWNEAFSGNVQIKVYANNECGSGLSSEVLSVFVKPLPAMPSIINGLNDLCTNAENQIYAITPINHAESYLWTLNNEQSGTITGSGVETTINWNDNFIGGIVKLNVKGINSCGTGSTSADYSINLRPLPLVASMPVGEVSLCINSPDKNYTTTNLNYIDSYNWVIEPTNAATLTGSGTNALINWRNDFYGTAILKVNGVSSCGSGPLSNGLSIFVRPVPGTPSPPIGTLARCEGSGTNNYNITLVGHADSYKWEISPTNAALLTGTGTSANAAWKTDYFGLANIKVQAVNICGSSAFSNQTEILVNPLPLKQTLLGPSEVCSNQSNVVYSVNELAGHTYSWQITSGVIISGGNSWNPKVKWDSGSGALTLTETISATDCELKTVFPIMLKAIEAPTLAEIKLKNKYLLIYKGMNLDNYQWYYNGNKIEGATKQFYAAPVGSRTGYYAIEVTKGQCSTRSADFNIGILKTDEADFDQSVQLYPNPTQGNANLEMLNNYIGSLQLTIVNQLGRIVHTATLQKDNGYLLYELPLGDLPNGFYQIEINAIGELPVVRKVIVQ